MLLTGLPVSANEALMAGLVSQVAPNEELDKVVADNVNAICHKSRSVIELGKKILLPTTSDGRTVGLYCGGRYDVQ